MAPVRRIVQELWAVVNSTSSCSVFEYYRDGAHSSLFTIALGPVVDCWPVALWNAPPFISQFVSRLPVAGAGRRGHEMVCSSDGPFQSSHYS